MDPTAQTFSSRKWAEQEATGHDLLRRVRSLRQRLTAQARSRCRDPHLLVT
ncbi:WD repeat-containing protein 67 [Cricetulus griseus]|nr:WD repeat-containing protein 67 [Cricetulus griseus]